MKQAVMFFAVLFIVFMSASIFGQDRFDRSAILTPDADLNVGGYGNVVADVDFDNDGYKEMYIVNNNWTDVLTGDQIPRIYKYELNAQGKWVEKWSTQMDANPNPFFWTIQNTWPTLCAADLDNDGKGEIVWGIVNFTNAANPNPPRIVVYETPGDGSDNMGIFNPADSLWRPNAFWTITTANDADIRPFRMIISDVDGDGTDEMVTALRAGSQRGAIYSVSNIPDNGDSTEVWTTEWEGLGANTQYDVAVVGTNIYFIRSNGDVTKVRWDSGSSTYVVGTPQVGLVPGGSWKTASVVDIDGNGVDEILVANWATTKKVFLLQESGDILVATEIADFTDYPEIRWFDGASAGDVDDDGYLDYIIGTRDFDSPPGERNNVVRLEYQGGDITSPASWVKSKVDKNIIAPKGAQLDVVVVANIDDDPQDEIMYAGVTRPTSGPPYPPLVILEAVDNNQPIIQAVVDVPNDQGRQVWVIWQAAGEDIQEGMTIPVAIYGPDGAEFPEIYINGSLLTPIKGTTPLNTEQITQYVIWRIDAGIYPVQVATIVPIQAPFYAAVVPTLGDGTEWLTDFIVSAHTPDPLVNWKSIPKNGYSIDNLIPTAPLNLAGNVVNNNVELSWDESPDPDFNYFSIRRGTQPGFDPTNPATEIGTTTTNFFVDQNVGFGNFFYRVVAYDFNGNQGEFSEELPIVVLKIGDDNAIPKEFALHQNYPNPFNPETWIAFDLPEAVNVNIVIYNTLGQKVKTLVNEPTAAGSYKILWDGTNDQGVRVASGVYIYTIKAGSFVEAKKMTLMR